MPVAVEQAGETGGTLSFPLHSWGVIDYNASADVPEDVETGPES